jgi:hypothetical protein
MLYWNFPKRLRFSDPPSNVANPILKTLSPIIIFSPDISWPTFGSRPSRASSYEHVAWAPKVWGKIGKSTLSRPTKNWGQWENLQRYSINHLKIGKCSVAVLFIQELYVFATINSRYSSPRFFCDVSLDLIFEKKNIQLRYEIPNTEVNPNVRKFSDNHHIKCLII